jgi:hypothetical protein
MIHLITLSNASLLNINEQIIILIMEVVSTVLVAFILIPEIRFQTCIASLNPASATFLKGI